MVCTSCGLEVLHAILGEQIKCLPSLVIELNAFARHAGLSGRIFATLWHFPQLLRSRQFSSSDCYVFRAMISSDSWRISSTHSLQVNTVNRGRAALSMTLTSSCRLRQ